MTPNEVLAAALVLVAVGLGGGCYAWWWAFQAATMARCASVDADRCRDQYLEARATVAEDAGHGVRWPLALVHSRRCAKCGSAEDPLMASQTGAGGRILIYFCKDVQACIERCRRSAP